MKEKIFIATYFDNYEQAFKLACLKKDNKGRRFEVINNAQGYFVVSKDVLKKVFKVKELS